MKTIIIVGITRSGLTLTMQMLEKGGYPCFGEYPAFENYEIGCIPWNECKGKAVKVVDTHIQFPPTGEYYVIRLHRDRTEQSKSQAKFLKLLGIPITKHETKRIEKSLLSDYKKIDNWAKRQVSVLNLHFEDLIETPLESAIRIKQFIGYDLDVKQMKKVVVDRSSKCYDGMLELEMLK